MATIIDGLDWVAACQPHRRRQHEPRRLRLEHRANNAVANLVNRGVTVVVAAGNAGVDATAASGGNNADVITVSALADYNGRAGGAAGTMTCRTPARRRSQATFSNWGNVVDIAAPGVCIRSTSANGDYEDRSGTSMAAPHVAGAAGLLASGPKKPRTRFADVLALRARLLATGNKNWTAVPRGANDPQEPLLDVHDPVVFAPTLTNGPVPASWRAAAISPGSSTRRDGRSAPVTPTGCTCSAVRMPPTPPR